MSPPRPFNPDALKPYAVPWLVPNVGNWSAVWRFTVLVPVEQLLSDGTVKPVASEQDVAALELMLIEHFGGITRPPRSLGVGARDPARPRDTQETNAHEVFQVFAPQSPASDQYFQALRFELQTALVEGQILIGREDVLLL
jgi:hypothetical protein